MANKFMIGIISISAALALSACSGEGNENTSQNESTQEETNEMLKEQDVGVDNESETGMDHATMNHFGSGEVPKDLKEAQNPTFSVGRTAIIQADHMPGMKNAEATIEELMIQLYILFPIHLLQEENLLKIISGLFMKKQRMLVKHLWNRDQK